MDSQAPGCACAEGRQCEHTARRPASQGERPQEKPKWQTPCSQTSSLQNCEKIHFCCVSHPVCGRILWQPGKTHATGVRSSYILGQLLRKCGVCSWGKEVRLEESSSCFTFSEVGGVGGKERYFLHKYLFCLL